MAEKGCFISILKIDKVEEYSEVHINAWPCLLKQIKEAGITEEVIFIYKNLALIYIEGENIDKAYKELVKTKIFKEWLANCKNMIKLSPDLKEKILRI